MLSRPGAPFSAARLMCDDLRGFAAIEFAVVAPVLLIAMIGFFETVQTVRAKSLLTAAVANMVEMIATEKGAPELTPGTMQDFCRAAQLTMRPFAATSLSMAIASVTNSTAAPPGPARDWEYDAACPSAASPFGANGAKAAATSMVPDAADSVIMIKASFTYTPSLILSATTFTQTVFARPRYNTVACPSC